MSTGKWRPRPDPPEHRPRNVWALIAQKYLDLAALDSKRAQVQGELSELYRTASIHEKGDAPSDSRNAA